MICALHTTLNIFRFILSYIILSHFILSNRNIFFSSADEIIQEFEKIRVLISSNGNVHWEPGGVFTTTCDIDITYFPFDEQACPIEIGAWSYKSGRMNLTNTTSSVETQEYKVNGEWVIRVRSRAFLHMNTVFPGIWISVIKRRRSRDPLIVIMGINILCIGSVEGGPFGLRSRVQINIRLSCIRLFFVMEILIMNTR